MGRIQRESRVLPQGVGGVYIRCHYILYRALGGDMSNTHTHIRTPICTHARTRMHALMHTQTNAHTYTCMHAHTGTDP